MKKGLFITKSTTQLLAENDDKSHGLKQVLTKWNLVFLGIGAVIGAGIFVRTGQAAAGYAGPAIALSYVLSGLGCLFAGLCYAEYAAAIPVAGSAYSYSYATLGEFIAWLIGWDLILEYMFAASSVAGAWSGHFKDFMEHVLGFHLPAALTNTPITYDVLHGSLHSSGALMNLPAMLLIGVMTSLLVIGISESAKFNNIMVIIKLIIIVMIIGFGFSYINWDNLHPFIPEFVPANPAAGLMHSQYGWTGIFQGAGVIFFAYIGFDAVSTAAQETKNPQKDVPFGMIGSLGICGILFLGMSITLCGLMPYKMLGGDAPVAAALRYAAGGKLDWLATGVDIAVLCGLSSVVLVLLMGQPRIFYAMSKDGLLPPAFSKVHPKYGTPYVPTIITGIACALIAGLVPDALIGELVSIGTLLAFVVVCVGVIVLRKTKPELPRPFKTPFVPAVPILGALLCLSQTVKLPGDTWLRLFAWMAIGVAIYFGYGIKHSKLRQQNQS